MKKALLNFVWAGTFSFALGAAEAPPRRLSLADAKKYAVQNNFEVLSLRRGVEESAAKVGRTRAPFYPNISVAGGGDSWRTPDGNQATAVGFLQAKYNVFSGFLDSYAYEIAALEAAKSEIRLKRAEFRVGLEVEKAFHLHIYLESVIALKKEAIKLNETHKKLANQRRASGLSAESDVMDFDLRDATLRSDLLLLQQEIEEARTNLKKLLGEEIGSQIEPVGELQHQHLKSTLDESLNRIKKESEPVLIGARDLAISTLESKTWRSHWLPQVDMQIQAGYLPMADGIVTQGLQARGMLLARFDIFSGFERLHERRETEAKRLRIEAELKQSILTAITDTENAYRRIQTIQARVDLEEQNEERAHKFYNAIAGEYRRGVKNSSDLKNAAEGLFEAAVRRQSFKFDFLTQRIELEKALGGPVETEIVADAHHHH